MRKGLLLTDFLKIGKNYLRRGAFVSDLATDILDTGLIFILMIN